MDQQMVSFRRIPEDDRAAGHTQRERERGKETGRGTERDADREGEEDSN